MAPEAIKKKIEENLEGSSVQIFDPRNDGVHLEAEVTYAGFQGKSLLEQHRLVMDILKEEFQSELHALALNTKVEG